ncbi:ArsR family transcriptional regulator [Candidatus Parcubacteria bacterium]|nr:MAG: ArsR family transcriptional regulator [Candidatus Parcubacteria bacterium]
MPHPTAEERLAQEITQLHATICQALSDPTRICILYALREGECNVSELVQRLGQPQPTISRHLKILRERNLVTASRRGTSVYYRLTDRRVLDALDILRAVLGDLLNSQIALAQAV